MKIFYAKAEPLMAGGPLAAAFVIAKDPGEALLLLRKDFNFSGYRMPPVELTEYEASHDFVRDALGDVAAHEKGVYGFRVLDTGEAQPAEVPPAAV